MRALTLISSVAIFAVTAAGCAAISGLDQLEKADCVDNCEGGTDDASSDVTMGGDVRADVFTGDDAPNDVTMGDDTSPETGVDGGMDSATDAPGDARLDAPSDAPVDAPTDAPHDSAPDADSGCGPTNTATNCAACGNVCNTTTSQTAPACNGTKCLYGACNAGRADCNASVGVDTDGCECNTPTCCAGNTCAVTHDNGVGQPFYDCVARDVYNQSQALEACGAFTGAPAQCSVGFFCTNSTDGGLVGDMVCSDLSPTACACWFYDGTFPGRVLNSGAPGQANCRCPNGTSAQWH